MSESSAHAPAAGEQTFDLAAKDANRISRGITVAPALLRWNGGECPFDDIVAIELLCDTTSDLNASCLIVRTSQSRLLVELTGTPRSEPAIYRNFLKAFVEHLGHERRARIVFRPADRGSPALIWGALLVASVGMFGWGVITNQTAAAPENAYIIPFTGFLIPLFALVFWRTLHRPKLGPLDPEKLEGFLPPTYYDRL